MRRKYLTQSLSYPIRLPDVVQADALRLLDVSREVINATVSALWDQLDAFGVMYPRLKPGGLRTVPRPSGGCYKPWT